MNLSQILKEEEEKKIEKEDILEDEEKNIPKKEEKKEEASRSRWLKYFGTSVAAAAINSFLFVSPSRSLSQ